MKIDILGTPYEIIYRGQEADQKLEDADGYCDFYAHKIVVRDGIEGDGNTTEQIDAYQEKVLRHEIVHAALYESGLAHETWAVNEEIVDWIAIQAPKLFEVFGVTGAMTCET